MKHLVLGFGIILLCSSGLLLAQEDNQTQSFAAERAEQIKNLSYHLIFDLKKGQQTYSGRARLRFTLSDTLKPLDVDFDGKDIISLTIDGDKVDSYRFNPDAGRISIPTSALKRGDLELVIDYEGAYVQNGQGLHKFVDPKDGLEYLYTHFEPNDAHRLFPCFDQPDLKGSYRVEVVAPVDWVVVSNGAPLSKRREDGKLRTKFKETKPFSTYIFQLSAGPYATWHDHTFRYPLGLYARQSLAEYVDAERFLEVTRKGFDFFEAYFDYPYPFEKYDQLLVPEFNIGAMENVAAVTFNEGYIFRTKPSLRRLQGRDLTIFHEMAHMWFGDLTTMVWWNDLWLKESFATYMSYLAMEGLGNKDAWVLSAGSKDSALRSDQMVTTHPILAEVPDVRAAAQIFDGITYGKGFAVLRQLDYYLGGTIFRDGCRRYFKQHEYGVTTLNDFIEALEAVAGRELDDWVQQWLATSDVNTVTLNYKVVDGKLADVVIRQEPGKANDVLRVHATDMALFYMNENGFAELGEAVRVIYDGAETRLKQLNGKKEPVFILPNYSDYDYAKVRLDKRSLAWVRGNIQKIAHTHTRQTVWRILWDMVRDAQLSAHVYLDLGLPALQTETDDALHRQIRDRMGAVIRNYIPDENERQNRRRSMLALGREQLAKAEPGSEKQRTWYGMAVDFAETEEELNYLKDLLEGRTLDGFDMTADRKWSLVHRLIAYNHPRAAEMTALVDKGENTARAKRNRLYAEALRPDPSAKQEAWLRVIEGNYSLRETFSIARGIHHSGHKELSRPFIQKYFYILPQLWKTREWVYVSRFAATLFPWYGYEDTLSAADSFLKQKDIDQTLRKLVLEQTDGLERTMNIRAAYGAATPE
ncbi:MAG: aminopeptidase N [Acidobacteriota bacterium]|nr:aminopeptidase N [Acidobacteriota bacterium]